MAKRQSGYMLTVKMFVPTDKTDFKATAKAAETVAAAAEAQEITADLAKISKVVSIQGIMTSMEVPDEPAKKAA